MKLQLRLLFLVVTLVAKSSEAQSIFYSPTAFSPNSDGSVWDINVTSGAIPAMVYEGWCLSSLVAGYDEFADFGQNFESSAGTINGSSFYSGNSGVPMAGAMINYLVDSYYGFWNEGGIGNALATERYNAFHDLIWEISDDYNPSAGIGSLDFATGNFNTGGYVSPSDSFLLSEMNSAFGSLSPSYVSTNFQLHVLLGTNIKKDGNPLGYEKQPLLLIASVPEPASCWLLALSGAFLYTRRSRLKAQFD